MKHGRAVGCWLWSVVLVGGSWAHGAVADTGPEPWHAALRGAHRADTGSDAAGAVDGTIDGNFGFHTQQQDQPWWQVDLGQSFALDRLVVYNRTVAAERASTLVVRLSDDAVSWRTVYEHDGTVFYGHADQAPLTVPLASESARYVRLQVRETTWMHLDEVQVYGAADPAHNLALHRPAAQSSVSGWSRTDAARSAVPLAELLSNVSLGEQVILELLAPCGESAASERSQLAALITDRIPLDDQRWVELHARSAALAGQWRAVRRQWDRVDLEALRLAITDLIEVYGPRYDRGAEFLRRLQAVHSQRSALDAALARGELAALRQAEEVIALQRDAMLANPILDGGRLLMVQRGASTPGLGLPANFNGNDTLPRSGYDDRLVVLEPIGPQGELATLYHPGDRFVGDIELNAQADRLLYSSLDEHGRWRIFELNLADGTTRMPLQIEEPDVDNYDACYVPDGKIVFTSSATYVGVPCVFGSTPVANLYSSDPRTGEIRRLTFDQDHNWTPTLMPDGRIMYQRWEYTDLAHPNSRILFAMNPDGTRQMALYGSNSYFPNSFFFARSIPDGGSKVIGVATGHHGTARSGRLLIIDPALGRQEAEGVVQEIPGRGRPVEAVVRDRLVDGVWPQFLHPFPLADPQYPRATGKYFLVSAQLSDASAWGVYLVDVFDNITLIHELPGYALFEPTLVQPTPPAAILADRTDPTSSEATVYLVDVYQGGGLAGVPRGEVKQLRVISYYYSSRAMGGLLGSIGMDGPWDIKQVLGTVPVHEDGSALFRIPANTPVAVQPLDADGQALQQMRSWFVGMPGEVVSCVGCHESPNDATINRSSLAFQHEPSEIAPWYGPRRGFSFAREVQPVLDHYCVTCHDGAAAEPDLRGTEMITDWNSQIAGHVFPQYGGKFSVAYAQLHRFVRRPGIESDLHMLPPLDFHADTTELVQILRRGHYQVNPDREAWDRLVTWIDLNAPYHGTWSEIVGREYAEPIVARRRELERAYGNVDVDWEYIGQPARLSAPNPAPTRAAMARSDVAGASSHSVPGPAESVTAESVSADHSPARWIVDLDRGVTMELTLVPAGSFRMGDPAGSGDASPATRVTLEQPFWLGTCEVTNEQYRCFDPGHDSRLESRHAYQFGQLGYPLNEPQQPVVRVSWHEALAFCDWLSERLGVRCSLPTEAQWEYACRAGTSTPFFFGDGDADFTAWANLGDRSLKEYASCTAHDNYSGVWVLPDPGPYDDWVPKDDRFDDGAFVAAEVGRYRANPWGLRDMHGNVWEWTRSLDAPYPYRAEDGRNEVLSDQPRIVRGGSWYDRPARAASHSRLAYRPYQRVFNVGFRVMIESDSPSTPSRLTLQSPGATR